MHREPLQLGIGLRLHAAELTHYYLKGTLSEQLSRKQGFPHCTLRDRHASPYYQRNPTNLANHWHQFLQNAMSGT